MNSLLADMYIPDKVERPSITIEDVDTTVWSSFEAGVKGAIYR